MRQKIIHQTTYKDLPINPMTDGLIEGALDKLHHQVHAMLSHHSKVLVVRLDLSRPTNPDFKISSFISDIKRRLENKYKSKSAYFMAREVGATKSKGEHYHLALMLKKHHRKQPATQCAEVFELVEALYKSKADPVTNSTTEAVDNSGFFLLETSKLDPDSRDKQRVQIQRQVDADNGYSGLVVKKIRERKKNAFVALGGVLDECFYALSYLCKVDQKTRLQSRKRSYSYSNLKPKA